MSVEKDVFELITSYKLGEMAEGRAYPKLVDAGLEYKNECATNHTIPTKEGFNSYLRPGEDRYMEETLPNEKLKTTGKWKYSKMPKAYRSAKSVVGTAIDCDISIAGKGKTQLEKECKVAVTKNKVDPLVRAKKLVNNVASIRDKLDTSERDQLDTYIKDTLGV